MKKTINSVFRSNADIIQYATDRLTENNLPAWKVEMTNSIGIGSIIGVSKLATKSSIILGLCQVEQRTIYLNELCLKLPSHEIRDTILHEIAHALAPGDNHGPVWQKKATELGCQPNACADRLINKYIYRWTVECTDDNCEWVTFRNRRDYRFIEGRVCPQCNSRLQYSKN